MPMNAARTLLLTLFAPALLTMSCGGSGGDSMPSNGCPAGTTQFSIDATYSAVVASEINDGCNAGLTAKGLSNARIVTFDKASGMVTVKDSASGSTLGAGTIKCNHGTLTLGPATLSDGTCTWTTNRTVEFMATNDFQVTLKVTDNRTDPMRVQNGSPCNQGPSCTIGFTLTMSK